MTEPLVVLQPAGRILGQTLESRDWSQTDFAAVIQRPVQFVSEIVNGKKEITRESAAQIGAALGTSPEFWLNLQNRYLLAEQSKNADTARELDEVRLRARLNDLAPIAALRKRGVLHGRTLDQLEREVLDLYELDSIWDDPDFVIAARRSDADLTPDLTPTQTAWIGCVRQAAKQRDVDPATYSVKALEALATRLPALLSEPDAFAGLPREFERVGVALVYVEALPGAKIDGCAFYLGKIPVIGLSGRGKRLDKVLFTLMHEVAHLVLGHLVPQKILIEALDDLEDNDIEDSADERAGRWLLPGGLPILPARVSRAWVEAQAEVLGVHPIVLIGRLQNKRRLPWRTPLVKEAPSVDGQLATWS